MLISRIIHTFAFEYKRIVMTKDIHIEYNIYEDAAHVLFEKKYTEDGNLYLQHLNIQMKSSNTFDYKIYKPVQMLSGDEILYHVSSVKLHKQIKKNGLQAKIGYIYANHWLSFTHNNEDIENNLQSGIFFTRNEPLHHAKGKYFCVSVRVSDLDQDKIIFDDAFRDDSSVFYNGNVPADKLIFLD